MFESLKNSISNSLSKRMIYTYVTVFIVIILTATSITFFYVRAIITDSIEDTLQGEADLIVSMIKVAADSSRINYLRTTTVRDLEVTRLYYQKYLDGELSEDEAKDKAMEVMKAQRIGKSGYIYIIDSLGVLRFHPELLGSDISSYDFVKSQIELKNGYIEYNWKNPSDSVEKEKALYMVYFEPWDWIISASSYKSEFNELIDIKDFEEKVLKSEFGKNGYSIVISGEGEFLIHPSYQGRNLILEGDQQGYVVNMVLEQRNGVVKYMWKNRDDWVLREKIGYIAELEDYDWYVLSTSYIDDIYRPLNLLTSVYLVIILVSVSIVSFITTKVSDSILSPILMLKDDMNSVKEGNFKGRRIITNKDEIGQLREHFYMFLDDLDDKKMIIDNEMHQKEEALKQLEYMNIELEEIVNDRTEELREAQKQLIQVEKYGAITKTITNIAHHINTPIGTCITLASYLKNSIGDITIKNNNGTITKGVLSQFLEESSEAIDIINESLTKSARTIKSFKLLELDYNLDNIEVFDLNNLVKQCFDDYKEEHFEKNFEFILKSDTIVIMKTYKELIKLIIQHLILNSLKHGFKDSVTGNVTVTLNIDGNELTYIHEDDGIGISEEDLPNIFEPFYSKKNKMTDVGLGLNTIYNTITTILNGSIVCESIVGEGTRFIIKIPVNII